MGQQVALQQLARVPIQGLLLAGPVRAQMLPQEIPRPEQVSVLELVAVVSPVDQRPIPRLVGGPFQQRHVVAG